MRLALAAIVFCSTLVATFGQASFDLPDAAAARGPSTAAVPADCAPADDEGEWRTRHGASASITDWTRKWRSGHTQAAATVTAIARDAVVVANGDDLSAAHAPRAPAYLLHTPLLI